jgi:3-hydroxyacyl-[acyl-carrier-protein] dehydratase
MVLNSNDIQKIIPHRYPFLLIDRVDELIVGERAVGVKCVTANELQFTGHFPEEHTMPGVLMIEALAQLGAVVILSKDEYKGKMVYFAGIKEAKFRRKVIPGDVMKLETVVTKMRSTIGIGQAVAKVNDEIACEATLVFSIGK